MKAFAGNDLLVATLYSKEAVGGRILRIPWIPGLPPDFTFEFVARARFARHALAPRGRIEGCVESIRTTPDWLGPTWPCGTRAALEGWLGTSHWQRDLRYVLILHRGSPAGKDLWANGSRTVTGNGATFMSEEQDADATDPTNNRFAHLSLPSRLALDAFPPQEGYLCFDVTAEGPGTACSGTAWREAMIARCPDLVQAYVGEVEPSVRT